MNAPRTPRLIRVRLLADNGCDPGMLRRLLKGTGVEVDMTYAPKRVAPGIYVGRGFATERAWRKIKWRNVRRQSSVSRSADMHFFEEVRFDEPQKPITENLDLFWGAGAAAQIRNDMRAEVAAERQWVEQQVQAALGQAPQRAEIF